MEPDLNYRDSNALEVAKIQLFIFYQVIFLLFLEKEKKRKGEKNSPGDGRGLPSSTNAKKREKTCNRVNSLPSFTASYVY